MQQNQPESNGNWEELRLALIMNGGVSLAVWMGGVSNEIFRLVTQQHPVYLGLLEMTRTIARVDVISGTSAGGVNGAAMATALLYGGDFSKLRETWLDTGAFADLLRPPLGKNPGSLLQGDEYYLPALKKALGSLRCTPQTSAPLFTVDELPIDLRLTTTLLSGYQGRKVDDLGSPLHDVDYRAYFRFQHTPTNKVDDFANADSVVPRLARAARSSSSFPFAFEPSLVNTDDAGPYLANYQNATGGQLLGLPRYVVDGGVLDNKPFRGALDAIFAMPRSIGVRRILAYINPDPGDGPPFDPAQRRRGLAPPSLAQVLAASITGIPQSQTIADHLDEIETHNETVRLRRDSVLMLAEAFKGNNGRSALPRLASDLFAVYRKRRLATTFELFLFEPLSAAASRDPKLAGALASIGKQGRESLKREFTQMRWSRWIPQTWPGSAADPANRCSSSWQWGLFPVEFAAKVMLDLLRMMQSLADYAVNVPPQAQGPKPQSSQGRTPQPTGADWSDGNVTPGQVSTKQGVTWNAQAILARRLRATPPPKSPQGQIADLWGRACKLVEQIGNQRITEQPEWDKYTDEALKALAEDIDRAGMGSEVLVKWMRARIPGMFAFVAKPKRCEICARLAWDIAVLVREASGQARKLVSIARESKRLRPGQFATATSLDDLAILLEGGTSEQDTLFTLLQMEVAVFAFNDHDVLSSDTLIELVQISGNSTSPIGGHSEAKAKLLGLQLAHFGAFYKRSWRANDWTFGRLDGSERLVKILLNPERLQRFYHGNCIGAAAAIRYLAVTSVASDVLRNELDTQWQRRSLDVRILSELAFLCVANQDPPSTLPACAEAITLRLHYGILRDELGTLSDAVNQDVCEGADRLGAGQALVENLRNPEGRADAPFSPAQAAARLNEGLIARETLLQEAGSDLFTRTLAHTLAITQGTLAAKSAKLGPVSLFFAALRLPLLAFHYVAQGLTRQSRSAAALHGGMLAIGLSLVLLQFLWLDKSGATALPTSVLHFGWALLSIGLLLAIVRLPYVTAIALLAAALALICYGPILEVRVFVALALLLVLSLRWHWLQTIFGLAVIAVAALHDTTWNHEWNSVPWTDDVVRLALLIMLALAFAILQATGLLVGPDRAIRALSVRAKRAEQAIRALFR